MDSRHKKKKKTKKSKTQREDSELLTERGGGDKEVRGRKTGIKTEVSQGPDVETYAGLRLTLILLWSGEKSSKIGLA